MNRIAVFDLDGTVYTHGLTFTLAEELLDSPSLYREKAEVATARKLWKERGSTESYWIYNKKMLEVFERILPSISPAQLKVSAEHALAQKGSHCFAYTTHLIRTLKNEGRTLVAISGSIQDMVLPFARSLGFDIIIASELEIVNGTYTGKRISQTNKNKHKLLADIVAERGLTLEGSIGVGDTHRDASILEAVEQPIAFNPNAALYERAVKNGWKIVIERKNMIYELSKGSSGYLVSHAHPSHPEPHQEELR